MGNALATLVHMKHFLCRQWEKDRGVSSLSASLIRLWLKGTKDHASL